MERCKVDGCDRKPFGHGMCQMHHKRWWRTGSVEKLNGSRTSVGYKGAHERVRIRYGPASTYLCEHCDERTAQEWAYDYSDSNELIGFHEGRAMTYSPDPEKYLALCKSCHRKFDFKHKEIWNASKE